MSLPKLDRAEVLRTWAVFRDPGEILELRVPSAGKYKTISGYFKDPERLADAVVGLEGEPLSGIYFTVNPVNPDLLARAANRIERYAKTTTSDADIIALHWLPVDLDPKRPAGISSSDAEHDAAISRAEMVARWLIDELGWPECGLILADSGNGAHLNARIDLPNSPESVSLVRRCLEALDFCFSDESVAVDTTSQNPARIWKLYGTWARKGDSTADRPHRMARLLKIPEKIEMVSRELLEQLAGQLPSAEESPKSSDSGQGFDPVAYCQQHSLAVHHTKPYQGGTLAVLEQCVFNPSHHLSACIIGWPSGARTYKCRHHSCLNKRWKDARVMIEPTAKPLAKAPQPPEPTNGVTELTVVDAISALVSVCDGAHSKDGAGFNKFDRGRLKPVIEKVMAGEPLSVKDENRAHYALKKYSKQLATLGINYDNIGIIERGSGEGGGDKETQSTLLVRLVEGSAAELWHTPSREPYVTVNVSGHLENYLLGSQAARDWISRLFYQEQEKSPANQSLYDALGVLRGKALFDGPEYQTHCRLAGHHDRVYIDLGRPDWEAVEVSAEGWQVISQAPVKFIRPSEMLPMPLPERGGRWDDLRGLVNAQEDDTWILMVAWLIQAFWPAGPYAHLVLIGEQGSIKTSVSKTLMGLAGPSKGALGKKPADAQSLLIRASWNRIIGFDNLSGVIDSWFSDTLCGLSTGTAIGQRKLYTDFDQAVLEVKRPALLNGIDVIIPRGDLADRAIILELLPVESRALAGEIEAKFQAAWPRIFGLLLDATAEGLRNAGMVDLSNLPRMADFAAWVMACEPAMPWKPGEFMAAYARNRKGRALDQVMIDKFAATVYEWAQTLKEPHENTPAGFLTLMECRVGEDTVHRYPGWPADATRMGGKLRRIIPILRSVGVRIERIKSDGKRMIRVERDARDARGTLEGTLEPASCDHRDAVDANPFFTSQKKGKEEEKEKIEAEPRLDRKGSENSVHSVPASLNPAAGIELNRDARSLNRDAKDASTLAGELSEAEERRRQTEERAKTPDLEAFRGKVVAHQQKCCHQCGTLLAGVGGRQDPETLKWYCMSHWQENHPRADAEEEATA